MGVICGDAPYPTPEELRAWMDRLTGATWFIDATDEAVELGNPILGNVVLVGVLAGVGDLPLDREGFRAVMERTLSKNKIETNLRAFDKGVELVRQSRDTAVVQIP